MISKIYVALRAHYLKAGTNVQFRLNELADFWSISNKQAQRRLRGLATEHFLTYAPGQGRGHFSQIVFLNDFQEEISESMRQAIRQNDTATMFYLFQLDLPSNWLAEFRSVLSSQLGIQTQGDNKRILRQVSTRKITSLDPTQVAIYHEYLLVSQLGDTLVKFDNGLQPGLAHHWTANEATTCWTFYLRKGVQFHNGKEMTSHDVKKTLERAQQKLGHDYWQLSNLERVLLLADDMVQFQFNAPEPMFPRFLADVRYVIMDCDVPFNAVNWIGTGPFQVVENTDRTFRMSAFNNYYGFRAMIDEVEYRYVDDLNVAKCLFNPENYGHYDYIKAQRAIPGAEFVIANLNRQTPIQNKLVRSALYNVIDMRYYDTQLGVIASHYNNKDSVIDSQKSIERGSALIEASGYEGEPLVLGALSHLKAAIDLAEWIQERAKLIGINVQILPYNFTNDFYSNVLEQKADLVLLADVPMKGDELDYIEFITSPTLIVQKMLSLDQKKYLQSKVIQFKQAVSSEQRYAIYLQIDSWLTNNFLIIYTVHAVRDVYVHELLANGEYNNDYKNAWQMPEQN